VRLFALLPNLIAQFMVMDHLKLRCKKKHNAYKSFFRKPLVISLLWGLGTGHKNPYKWNLNVTGSGNGAMEGFDIKVINFRVS